MRLSQHIGRVYGLIAPGQRGARGLETGMWALALMACALSAQGREGGDTGDAPALRTFPRVLAAGPSGAPLSDKQVEAIEAGEVLTHLAEETGSAVKKATAVALIDAIPEAVFAVILDFERFPDYMAYVETIEILGETDQGETRVRFLLDLPWPVGNRHYTLIMDATCTTTGDHKTLISRWRYEPGSGNIVETRGHWRIHPYDGKRSLVEYMVLTDPGGKVPAWMADKATAIAVPQVFASVREEVAQAERRSGAKALQERLSKTDPALDCQEKTAAIP